MNLEVNIAGVPFKNPVIAASGTFGFGKEYAQFYDIAALGGICTKGLTLMPRQGNAAPRIAETASGILNSVGLQTPGVDTFLRDYADWLQDIDCVIIANVAGSTQEEYVEAVRRISAHAAIDMVELNISCPNVKAGGMAFGVEPQSVEAITNAVRRVCTKPMIVKLSPNVANIADNARAAEAAGADAVSLINTLGGMGIDHKTRRPVLANVCGGLSGAAVKPVALKMVYETSRAVQIPIIGIGGIMCAEDVVEFVLAGASAVQVGTANLYDPMAAHNIVNGLDVVLNDMHVNDINELVGGLIV
jgi:dihydroorotate dehydrogenase (NAD+) catalytic subunit